MEVQFTSNAYFVLYVGIPENSPCGPYLYLGLKRTQIISRENECADDMGCFPDKEYVFFGVCRKIKDRNQSKN